MPSEFHRPVLVSEVLEGLITDRDGLYLDATVGGGGHSAEILSRLSERGRLVGFDRDPSAVEASTEFLSEYGTRVVLKCDLFWNLESRLRDLSIQKIDGVLFDLGVSSHQIEEPSRGFSYRLDGPLDMRMGREARGASEMINAAPYQELLRIFREFGEERKSSRIAKAICIRREQRPILRTGDLSAIIRTVIPRDQSQKALARIFQAIRIEVNTEIEHLRNAFRQAVDFLTVGGRIAVISYHSIEDRTVKRAFSDWTRGCICPPDFPFCRCGVQATLRYLREKRKWKPGPDEIADNPRSRSATLRMAQKI